MLEPRVLAAIASPDVLDRLWTIIDSRKGADPGPSHSARLLARGTPQVVQKLGEELVECLIEAMVGNHAGLVAESADVLYHGLKGLTGTSIPLGTIRRSRWLFGGLPN